MKCTNPCQLQLLIDPSHITKACVDANFLPSVYQCVLLVVSLRPSTSTMLFLYTKRFCDAICSCISMLSGLYLPVEISAFITPLQSHNTSYFMAGRDLKSSLYERMWLTNDVKSIFISLYIYIYIYLINWTSDLQGKN